MGTCASQHMLAMPLLRWQPPRQSLLTVPLPGPPSCLVPSPQPTVLAGQEMARGRGTFRAHQSSGEIFEIWFDSSYFPGPPGGHLLQVHHEERLKWGAQLSINKAEMFPFLRPEDSFDDETREMWGSTHPFLMSPGESHQL